MKFAFSTVSCPAWDFDTVVARASEYGYDGVEIRAFSNESVLTAANVFLSDPQKVRALFEAKNLEICCLASSIAMTQDKRRDRAIADDLRRHIDTARAIGCPVVKILDTRARPAWQQGDAAGVRESFDARDADESRLLAAMAELAPAQATMRTTYEKSLGTLGRMIFGDADPATLVIAPRPWDAFADAAAQPHELVYAKPDVLARLAEKDEDMTLRVRNVGGAWKIDLDAFVMGDDVAQLATETQRQVRHAREMTDAMRTKDPARVRQTI